MLPLRKRILPILGILFAVISCNDTPQKLEPYTHETDYDNTPFFSVVYPHSSRDNVYRANFHLRLNDTSLIEHGQVYLNENIFYGRLNEVGTEDFKLFDLNSDIGFNDTIRISYKSGKDELEQQKYRTIHENIIPDYNGLDVHTFRIEDYYSYFEYDVYDVVIFITKQHGVIGSYIADEYNGELIYISPAGDIL